MLPSPRKPEQPVLWIIAGPNGSGKSSFYGRTDIEGWGGSVWIINPDLLTQRLSEAEGLQNVSANRTALDRIQAWLESSIEVHQTVGVETVLSTGKYRNLVRRARLRGFEIRLIYIFLRSADLQRERIAIRVREGGHMVPDSKVRSRRLRSFRQMRWFCMHSDRAYFFDNSTGDPELVAFREGGETFVQRARVPADLMSILRRQGVSDALGL